jgi:hypothetical protein
MGAAVSEVSCGCYAYDAGEVELDPMFGQFPALPDISLADRTA